MKSKNWSDYVIALTVIACSAVLLAALTMALSGFRMKPPGNTVEIYFSSVTGIRVSSQVRYAGVMVGRVIGMHFLTTEERQSNPPYAVRVVAELEGDAPKLYEGTTASIMSDTVLAEKFVELVPVSLEGRELNQLVALKKGDVILGAESVGLDELTKSGHRTMTGVNDLIGNLKENYPKVRKIIGDLQVTSQNLKVTTTYTKTLTATVAKRPWRFVWGGDEPNDIPSEEEILKAKKPIPHKLKE